MGLSGLFYCFWWARLLGLINQLSAFGKIWGNRISLFFLDFIFPKSIWLNGQAMANADYGMLLLSMVIWLHIYFRTVRWQWFLADGGNSGRHAHL
jgi:hypothetical protein